jgi:hypothetical protein
MILELDCHDEMDLLLKQGCQHGTLMKQLLLGLMGPLVAAVLGHWSGALAKDLLGQTPFRREIEESVCGRLFETDAQLSTVVRRLGVQIEAQKAAQQPSKVLLVGVSESVAGKAFREISQVVLGRWCCVHDGPCSFSQAPFDWNRFAKELRCRSIQKAEGE